MNIAVIGAGVVGLTAGLELQNNFPGSNVTILADRFDSATSSYSLTGVFNPSVSFRGPTEQLTGQWIKHAYAYWENLAKSEIGPLAGVTQLSVYSFATDNKELTKNHHLEHVLPVYRTVTKAELDLCPGQWNYGSYFITIMTDFSIFHSWATNKFTSSRGVIKNQHIATFAELAGSYDIIVNCSGLGSRALCNDNRTIPIRTQNVRVKASWLKTGFYANNDTYAVPAFNGEVILGHGQQFDTMNGQTNDLDSFAIRTECTKLLPSLHSSVKLGDSVSLNGFRDEVRIECDRIELADSVLHIVHNYGYGSTGVMVAPGAAKFVVQLVKQIKAESKL